MKIKRALVSVFDKTGICDLCNELVDLGIEIISSGGTAIHLTEAGIPVTPVSDVTGFPEILDGRIKTLHPHIHAGLLADTGNPEHTAQLRELNLEPFGLVVVNLYPFQEAVSKNHDNIKNAVEFIDIGGPSMIRAAAKNFGSVGVVTDPADYHKIIAILKKNENELSYEKRMELAVKVFRKTSVYDRAIADYLEGCQSPKTESSESLPHQIEIKMTRESNLRYGENPHQAAAVYKQSKFSDVSILDAGILSGKALSFNNYLDLLAAWRIVQSFDSPAVSIIKHQNPCGAAVGDSLLSAFVSALACDPLSAYGGIVALNGTVDIDIAEDLHKTKFIEVIAAPSYSDDAIQLMRKKKNRRIIRMPAGFMENPWDIRIVPGAAFVQQNDCDEESPSNFHVVTAREPTSGEYEDLRFAWKICRFVKSNAIVYAKDMATIGIGAGQVSRVDAAIIAARKAGSRCHGGVMASDAFFPFRDGVDTAADAGITAVIQPGGSKRDLEVIEACNERGLAMVFTGIRHFRH
jgi:phosphoribosylaminoimidazolecarboxamide formyltransferase / IMP cyclohydrolase